MSTAPIALPKRHALKLPAGSVRAIHVLGIVGLICAIILIPGEHTIPPYLIYLLFMMVGHYFASHGVTIARRDDPSPSPLYLPGGTVRILITVALVGCVGWKLYDDQAGLIRQFRQSLDKVGEEPILPLVILGGFFLGTLVRAITRRFAARPAFQDFEAWVSLIALLNDLRRGPDSSRHQSQPGVGREAVFARLGKLRRRRGRVLLRRAVVKKQPGAPAAVGSAPNPSLALRAG